MMGEELQRTNAVFGASCFVHRKRIKVAIPTLKRSTQNHVFEWRSDCELRDRCHRSDKEVSTVALAHSGNGLSVERLYFGPGGNFVLMAAVKSFQLVDLPVRFL